MSPKRSFNWSALLAALIGIAITLVLFSPGHLDPDTIWQLEQATNRQYDPWHPPFMALLWSFALRYLPGPWGPFLFSALCYWAGLALILTALFSKRRWFTFVLILFLGLSPPLFSILALVWKDALFGATLLLASALCLRYRDRPKVGLIAASPFFICALLVRYNSLFALLPFVAYFAHRWTLARFPAWPVYRLRIFATLMSLVAVCSMILLTAGVSSALVPPKKQYAPQVLMVFDLAGISVNANKYVLPTLYDRTLEDIRSVYMSNSVLTVLWGRQLNDRHPGFIDPRENQPVVLKITWLKAILEHPASYLTHRLNFFARFLGIGIGPEQGRIYFEPNGIPSYPSPMRVDSLASRAVEFLKRSEDTWLFRAYVYLILLYLSALMLWGPLLTLEDERLPLVRVFWWSATMYLGSYAAIGVASDYRYGWWSCLMAVIVFFFSTALFIRQRLAFPARLTSLEASLYRVPLAVLRRLRLLKS